MSKSSATSAARNAIYGATTWFLPLGLSVVATPIIVKSLGHNGYGIYSLILGVIGYSFNLNTGRAVTKFVAEYRANGEDRRIEEVVSTTFAINLAVGTFGAVVLAALAGWLVRDVFRIDAGFQAEATTALYLAGAIVFVTMQWQVFLSVLQGFQRYDYFSRLTNAVSIATIGGNVLLALGGYGLTWLLAWNAAVICAGWAVTFWVSRGLLGVSGIVPVPKGGALRRILAFSGGVIGYQIVSNAVLLFERGWIIRKLGEENLTYYVVPMTLGIYLHGFISSLLLVVFPLSSELGGDPEKLRRLYLKATKIVCFLLGFVAVTLIVQSRVFLTLWMGETFGELSSAVLVVHTLTFAIAALLVVTWNMTEGLGYPSHNFAAFTVCFVIAIGAMVALTESHGIYGAAIGRLAGFAALLFYVFYAERKFFGKIQFSFWLRTALLIGIAAAVAAGIEIAVLRFLPFGWAGFVAAVGAGGIGYCLTVWLTGFVSEDEIAIAGKIFGSR